MVWRPQIKKSNWYIIKRHPLKKLNKSSIGNRFLSSKKVAHPSVGVWAFATVLPFLVVQVATVSSFSMLKVRANDRNFLIKKCEILLQYVRTP